jgi:hypothetical protein
MSSGLPRLSAPRGLKIEHPEEISSTLKKALAMEGPVIVGVPVDYRDNHRLMEDVHPAAGIFGYSQLSRSALMGVDHVFIQIDCRRA